MFLTRRSLYVFPSALALLPASATAQALPVKERTLFTWNGTVDREVLLYIRGRNVETRASGRYDLKAGDRFLLQSAGGGGYGDPRARDPAAVASDVAEGYVTRAAARDVYGGSD